MGRPCLSASAVKNLSWGETDAFRLLDQINPLDASFGGFLVSLDDRRVPLDMARVVYSLEDIGPFSELNLEAFGVLDDAISVPTPARLAVVGAQPAGHPRLCQKSGPQYHRLAGRLPG